ncbi:MAG: hypothetical protein ACR2O6_15815, partial [Ilumatobacteraceae bacterium]
GLVLATIAGLVGYGGMVGLDRAEGTLRAGATGRTIVLYFVAFAGFVLALWWHERRGIPWRWLWIAPIVFRVLLLFTAPTLSDDVYRYLWDGHLLTEGVNPYSAVVDDPALDEYETEVRAHVNNPTYATPYLPATQLVFGGAAAMFPSEPIVMQLLMVGFDLVAALLIVRLLALAALPRGRVLLYLWNPLVIVEVAHGAHLDGLMLALTLSAVLATLQRPARAPWPAAPVALGLATLTRLVPVLALPTLWWRWTRRQRMAYGGTLVLLLVPFATGAGWGLTGTPDRTGVFGSIRVFVDEVTFNGGLYQWLDRWLTERGMSDPAATARLLTGLALVVVLAAVALRARRVDDDRGLLRLLAVPFMASILLASILHPWYVLIVLALLPFIPPAGSERRQRWWYVIPWLYLAAALPLSYLTYREPEAFGELEWVRRVEWLPMLALLVVTTWLGSRGRTTRSAAPALETRA